MGLLSRFDRRTQMFTSWRRELTQPRPGAFLRGSLWRSLLLFLFIVQVVSGVVLMAFYSPSTATAWGSVWYVQTQVPGGWVIRSVHHFASDALLILLLIYAISLLVRRAYRAPAEWLWWTVVLAVAAAIALSLTGELLPWDQQGYWGTMVRANILARTPLIGPALKEWLIGGPEPGNLTLSRFYALHVIVLPALLVLFFVLHRRAWRAQVGTGPTAVARYRVTYFPWRMLRDTFGCALLLAAVYAFVWNARLNWGWPLLEAPADPTAANYPARPEWHTIFLFQWLKYYEGPALEAIGAIILPGVIFLLVLLFPYAHRWMPRRLAHAIVLLMTILLLGGVFGLSAVSLREDRDPPKEIVAGVLAKQQSGQALNEEDQRVLRARQFNTLRTQAAHARDRAFELAEANGIPPEGAASLLANDPLTRGPVLFAANCASCHRFDGHDGRGNVPREPAASSDLAGFASREWIRRLLSDPMDERHFGRMRKPDGGPAHTKMAQWTGEQHEAVTDEQTKVVLEANLDSAAAYLEDESRSPGRLAEQSYEDFAPSDPAAVPSFASDEERIRHGRWFFMTTCNECHSYQGERSGFFNAPEMHGYGSAGWIELMVAEPSHETLYRKEGREPAQMPGFRDQLSEAERRVIAQWLNLSKAENGKVR